MRDATPLVNCTMVPVIVPVIVALIDVKPLRYAPNFLGAVIVTTPAELEAL